MRYLGAGFVLGCLTLIAAEGPSKADLRAELERARAAGTSQRIVGILDSLGQMEFAAGNHNAAKKYFIQELPLTTGDPKTRSVALGNTAQTCLALGENRVAETYLREALTLSNAPELWHLLGQALFLQNRLTDAETAYRNAVAGDLHRAGTWSDLALVAGKRGDYREAVDLFRRAAAINPSGQSGGRVLRNLAIHEWQIGAREDAIEHLSQAVKVLESAVGSGHPEVAMALTDYSTALAMVGRKRESRAAAQRAGAIRKSFAGHNPGGTIDWRELSSAR